MPEGHLIALLPDCLLPDCLSSLYNSAPKSIQGGQYVQGVLYFAEGSRDLDALDLIF
jgi:hypothetical protein